MWCYNVECKQRSHSTNCVMQMICQSWRKADKTVVQITVLLYRSLRRWREWTDSRRRAVLPRSFLFCPRGIRNAPIPSPQVYGATFTAVDWAINCGNESSGQSIVYEAITVAWVSTWARYVDDKRRERLALQMYNRLFPGWKWKLVARTRVNYW